MPLFVNYNGTLVGEDTPLVRAGNRGLRYGDGVFETMKVIEGEIRLGKYHFERLFESLHSLQFTLPDEFTPDYLKAQILLLTDTNRVRDAARVRISCFRKEGNLYQLSAPSPDFIIEAVSLSGTNLELNKTGLAVDIYPEARKSCDRFASIKSNNYLPYLMGALFARQHKLDDALILNTWDRICDSTISNIFWIRQNRIYTPPLSEGCIGGVMRRHLLQLLPAHGFKVEHQPLTVDELNEADEVFLTNALSGIRWVGVFRTCKYKNNISQSLYSILSKPL